jgi:polysaccharide biosynthesis transport protein
MLKPIESHCEGFPTAGAAPCSLREDSSDLDRLLSAVRRQVGVTIACCALALIAGITYVAAAVPQYTAFASLMIDYRQARVLRDGSAASLAEPHESTTDSQVEVLQSNRIAFAVIDKLQLHNDPEFGNAAAPDIISRVRSLLPGADPESAKGQEGAERRRFNALTRFQSNLQVRRVQSTLVMEIRFRSSDRHKAAVIANAIADAYLMDQLDSRYEATRRASSWLLDRMAELKQQVLMSDLAVQRFRAEHDLIWAGGKLVGEQQLGEVNTQLVTATAETAKAEARYARIKSIIDTGKTDAVVTEAIGNNAIDQLRLKFLNAAKRESDLAPKLGPTHAAVAAVRMELRQYERLMFEELGRIAEGYFSDVVIARSKEKAMRDSLKQLVGGHASANETAVALRELEREAETYRALYQTFLQRYQEAVQQQSFPITEARIISGALIPDGPSHPRKSIILAVSLLLGCAFGAALGALRELRDRAFRTEEQVRDDLRLEFLGMLPLVPNPKGKERHWRTLLAGNPASAASEAETPPLPSSPNITARAIDDHIMRYAINHPLSDYAEVLRGIRLAAELTLAGRTPKIIGAVSVLPNEGKSTVAKNLASLLAQQGAKTLLIDADLRSQGLTRSVAPDAEAGLVQAVLDGTPIKDLLHFEPDSNLAVLPVVLHRRLPHASELLASAGMKSAIEQARQGFDWIVLDLPPLGPVVDARAIVGQIDAFVLVVEWGRTTRRLVRTTLDADGQIRDKCLGVVFNKVNLKNLKLYDAHGSKAYYIGEYSSYYHGGR